MVMLSPRYDMVREKNGRWSIRDHMPDGKDETNTYVDPGKVIERGLTEERAIERLSALRDADLPRLQAQLRGIYQKNGLLPTG